MMSYDLHGTWDGTNPYLGPYVNSHTNLTEIDRALELLWRNDVDPKKVVMGMGFYGRSFTLSNPSCKSAGCGFSAGGTPGRCSASAGTLMFSEIQEIIDKGGAQVTTDKTAAVKIVTWGGNQWVSYDDEETLKLKMDYANGKCLGGVMVWAASTDDAKGTAIKALAKASGRTDLSKSLFAKAVSSDPSQCVWGECGASCPSGLVPVESSGSNASPLGIELGCNQGKRNFCCPSKNPPTCKWKGSPKFCGALAKNRCSGKEIEIAASTDGCWTGHKSLCCTKTDSTSTLDSCEWLGAAPFCSAGATFGSILGLGTTPVAGAFSFLSYGCPNKDKPKELTTGKQGEGGQQTCAYNGGFKSYCCKDPVPWKECKWQVLLDESLTEALTDCLVGDPETLPGFNGSRYCPALSPTSFSTFRQTARLAVRAERSLSQLMALAVAPGRTPISAVVTPTHQSSPNYQRSVFVPALQTCRTCLRSRREARAPRTCTKKAMSLIIIAYYRRLTRGDT